MATVTIGVPVYNGASLIAECLECLCNQTFKDIEIVVSDNASTDETGDIVQQYAARDPRIRYIRQTENIGMMKNFKAALDAARSPFFTFRCHDDLSSNNYIEALLARMMGDPEARLAAPKVETRRKDGTARYHLPPAGGADSKLSQINNLLRQSHQAWFCGMWKTASLRPALAHVWERYDSPWGPDHLTLYSALISREVVFAPDAVYIQRITPKSGDGAYSKPKIWEMLRLRRIFMQVCRDFRREHNISGFQEFALAAMTWSHTGRRVMKMRDIVRYFLLGRW